MCWLACCAIASGADAAVKTRVWKVSDAAGLLAAAREIGPDGGLITLDPGEYEISEPLVFKAKSSVNIVGSGWSTIIKRKGAGDAIVFEGSCWNCRVYGLALQGNKDAKTGSGIVFRKGEWSGICVVDYCHIDDFPEHGISFEGDPKKPMSSNTISNCWLTNNLGDQLHSATTTISTSPAINSARARPHPTTGARLDHSSAGTYTLNYHWGNVVALRLGPGSHFNRIENNRFEQSRETGILIGEPKGDACQLNIILGNTIHTNSEGDSGTLQRSRGTQHSGHDLHVQPDLQLGLRHLQGQIGGRVHQPVPAVDRQRQYHSPLHRTAHRLRLQRRAHR